MYRFTGAVMVLSFLSVAAFAQEADMIFTGADVVTMNPNQPNAEAVAVKDGRILAVGTAAEVAQAHQGDATDMVNLAGKTLLPGLIDPHSHFINALPCPRRPMCRPRPLAPPAPRMKLWPNWCGSLMAARAGRIS